MLHPKRPLRIVVVHSGEKADRVLCHFIRVLLAESGDSLQSGSFDSISEGVPICLNLYGLLVNLERVLWYDHPHSTTDNSLCCICVTVVLWRLCVTKELERFPQKARKTLPVESVGVDVARTIRKSARNISHMKQNSNGKMSPKKRHKNYRI